MRNPIKIASYAWRRHRWRIFGPLLWQQLRQFHRTLREGRPAPSPTAFDLSLGIETYLPRGVSELDVNGRSALHAVGYQPIQPDAFRSTMEALGIEPSRFTLIDYGSGKGRALILASQMGFRRIIGVEFSRELHVVAERNVATVRSRIPNAERIELICADAKDFQPPDEPLVCYFYNPFDSEILSAVLDRLEASASAMPREILIAYVQPDHRRVMDARDTFNPIGASEIAVFFRLDRGKTEISK